MPFSFFTSVKKFFSAEKLKLPQVISSADNINLNLFVNRYNSILESQSFGFFRCSNLSNKNSLHIITQHAISYDNRTRKAFIELGWMNKKGQVLNSAPLLVQRAYQDWKAIVRIPANRSHYNGGSLITRGADRNLFRAV